MRFRFVPKIPRRCGVNSTHRSQQVMWSGTFNLVNGNNTHGYEGQAWYVSASFVTIANLRENVFAMLCRWDAVVVQRAEDLSKYKVHFPNWDASVWDEWVDANRIRWSPDMPCFDAESTAFSLTAERRTAPTITAGDAVEVLCPSTAGVSPWLESRVSRVVYSCASDGHEDRTHQYGWVKAYVCNQGILTAPSSIPPGNVRLIQRKRNTLTVEDTCINCSPRPRARAWGAPPATALARTQIPAETETLSRWQRARVSLKRIGILKW